MSADVTSFFENAAAALGVSSDALADLVNAYDDSLRFEMLLRSAKVEVADVAAVRTQLLLLDISGRYIAGRQ